MALLELGSPETDTGNEPVGSEQVMSIGLVCGSMAMAEAYADVIIGSPDKVAFLVSETDDLSTELITYSGKLDVVLAVAEPSAYMQDVPKTVADLAGDVPVVLIDIPDSWGGVRAQYMTGLSDLFTEVIDLPGIDPADEARAALSRVYEVANIHHL